MESDALRDPRLDSRVHSLTNSGINHPLSGFFIGNTGILGFHWSFVYSSDWFSGKVKLEKQEFQCFVKHQDVLSLNSSESRKEVMFCWPWSGRNVTEGNGSCLGLEGWLGRTSAVRGDEAMGSRVREQLRDGNSPMRHVWLSDYMVSSTLSLFLGKLQHAPTSAYYILLLIGWSHRWVFFLPKAMLPQSRVFSLMYMSQLPE